MATDLTLTQEELVEITGGKTQAAAQLKELHRRGFLRASRPGMGPVVLSRAHYLAVEQSRLEQNVSAQAVPAAPNIVGLDQWTKQRKHGTQTQRR